MGCQLGADGDEIVPNDPPGTPRVGAKRAEHAGDVTRWVHTMV